MKVNKVYAEEIAKWFSAHSIDLKTEKGARRRANGKDSFVGSIMKGLDRINKIDRIKKGG